MREDLQPQLRALRALYLALAEIGIRPTVVGGLAVSMLALPRYTKDADALAMIQSEELPQVLAALAGAGLSPLFQHAEEFTKQTGVLPLRHLSSEIVVDLLIGATPFEQELVDRSTPHKLLDIEVWVPTVEDLIIMKGIAHRPQDMLDIEALGRHFVLLDKQRIQEWLSAYGELLDEPDLWSRIEPLLKST